LIKNEKNVVLVLFCISPFGVKMTVKPINVLGTFPITQQVLGAGLVVYGVMVIVANVAKRIFHGIQRYSENHKQNPDQQRINNINNAIRFDIVSIKNASGAIIGGILTMIPIVGSVIHARKWYLTTHRAQA
jgi:hypothetical protein